MPKRPNILFITTDMQRYDTLGCYGNELIRTPHIDALAATGVRFTRAFVNNPVCMPSRATLFTGKLPSAHGVRWNSGGLAADEVTVTRRLQEAGYETAAIGKMHWGETNADFGLDYYNITDKQGTASPGVTTYQQRLRAAGFDPPPRSQDDPDYHTFYGAVTSPLPYAHHVDGFIGKATAEFITQRKRKDDPFFCWCSFFGPHLPIDPAPPWDRLYEPGAMPLPVWTDDELANKPPEQRAFQRNKERGNGFGDYTRITDDPAKLRRFIAYYWGKISMIDHAIGEVMQALTEAGEAENTMIVFTSDHGDFVGNHRMLFKSALLYDDLVRVPLIIAAPSLWQARTVDEPTESIDLPLTMLRVAGLEPHAGMQGEDLTPLLEGESPCNWRTAVYAEAVDKRMIRTETWKLVHYAGRPYGELYHLANDPHELVNLYDHPQHAVVREDLRRQLLDRILAMEERLHSPVRYLKLDDPEHPGDPSRRVQIPYM